jgi:hypothetical protein
MLANMNWLDVRWKDVEPHHEARTLVVNGEEFIRDCRSSSRFVIEYCGLMIKLDTRRNSGQVLSELLLWPTIEEEDRDFFAAIVGYGVTPEGELWIAQEALDGAVRPETTIEIDALCAKVNTVLRPILSKYGIWDVFPWGWNSNWILTDLPKIYDWGINNVYNHFGEIPRFEWMADRRGE